MVGGQNAANAAAARRSIFVEAYIANGGNATEAAKKAGYSEKNARFQASRLLTDANIQAQIAARSEKVAKRYELTTDLVVRSIVDLQPCLTIRLA